MPNWWDRIWSVTQGDLQGILVNTDIVTVNGMAIDFRHVGVNTQTQPWGTLTSKTQAGGAGQTSDNNLFQITYNATLDRLTCTVYESAAAIPWSAVLLGAAAGAAVGAAADVIDGSLARGLLTGLLAAGTASLATAYVYRAQLPVSSQGGSVTWVAADGGAAGRPLPPQHYPLQAVSA